MPMSNDTDTKTVTDYIEMVPKILYDSSCLQKVSVTNDICIHFVEFQMCTKLIEALTPLYQTIRMKIYKNITRSRL